MTKNPAAFVIGHPIAHSKSPVLHGYWLEKHGLAGSYEPFDVSPETLRVFVDRIRAGEFVGGNVTIPHKEAVFELVDAVSDTAQHLGAANTLWMENGKLKATNSDGYGFAANLDQHAPGWQKDAVNRTCLVIGAGGAARAVVNALLEQGFGKVHLANRTISRAEKMAEQLSGASNRTIIPTGLENLSVLAEQSSLVVNTSSLGMVGHDSDESTHDFTDFLEAAPPDTIVTDIVYTPLMTPLLSRAQALGLKTVDGLGMLLHQAVPGFEKWFGLRPTVDQGLRHRVLEAMGLIQDRGNWQSGKAK